MSPIEANFTALKAAQIEKQPFPFCFVPNFIDDSQLAIIRHSLPYVEKGGSFPIFPSLCRSGLRQLADLMRGEHLKSLIGEKFGQNYEKCPTFMSLRGFSRAKDGRVHVDSKTKIVTILLYLSPCLKNGAGNLRLLHGRDEQWERGREIPSGNGGLLIFPNSTNSWHGYPSYVGHRYVLQVNYMANRWVRDIASIRHAISALIKEI